MRHQTRFFTHTLKNNFGFAVGYAIVLVVVLFAIFAPLVSPYSPTKATTDVFKPPSVEHWCGTDRSGMDVFTRMIYAPRVDLFVAFCATVLSMLVGVPLGVIAGYYSDRGGFFGFFSDLVMRAADILQAFPVFVLAIALAIVVGQNIFNLIYVIAFLTSPIYLRLVRAETLSIRERPFIEAARVSGENDFGILARYLLPNVMPPAYVQMSTNIGMAIILTAGVSFIGAGVRMPTPEWGLMVSTGAPNMMTGEWWIAIFPGLMMGLAVLGFALIGDSIAFMLDPKNRW
jgi:peptide/nickel transport system permease protein